MKRLLPLLLSCLLLCGCAGGPAVPASPIVQAPDAENIPVSLILPGIEPEQRFDGAVTVLPLPMADVQGIRDLEDGLLLFTGVQTTTLMLLTGENLTVTATADLGCFLDFQDPSLRLDPGGLSYYDSMAEDTVVMDRQLNIVSRIAQPEDLIGTPILSSDRSTLYYCSKGAVRAWDLESGIRRTVKEMAYEHQTLTGVFREDSLLSCCISDDDLVQTILLSAENGQQQGRLAGDLTLSEHNGSFYASFSEGKYQAQLFGHWGKEPTALTPADMNAKCLLLEQLNGAVTISHVSDDAIRLDYYELSSGLRRSSLTMDSRYYPTAVVGAADGYVYILTIDPTSDSRILYRWDADLLPFRDDTIYTGPHYTPENPDIQGLAQCQAYADALSEKFGISIRIWKEAAAVHPWDYEFEAEYLAGVLQQELKLLEQRLSRYPEGFLTETASHFDGLNICLVRSITGTAESGSLNTATGVQFFENEAYVVIAAGEFSEQSLYHELFHVMETHILTDSIAFDQWDKLNPSGFSYDYDYAANAIRDSGVYLQNENRAFVDTYSMSFPKEDRARIMEYAMLPGNDQLFRSTIMQKKLSTLCDGIREAYGLKKEKDVFPWEQYLD